MKTAIVAITKHGVMLAGKMIDGLTDATLVCPEKFRAEAECSAPGAVQCYQGKVGDQIALLFNHVDHIIGIISLGAVVRLMAPYLKSKETDPAVVVVDEMGRFVIPVLSGHLGGANRLAGHLASVLGAQAVLTTASDARETICVDLLGRELGWRFEASHEEIVYCSAAMVNDDPVALVQESGSADWWLHHANGRQGPLPANVTLFERLEQVDFSCYAAVLWVSEREMPTDIASHLKGRKVVYRP